MVKPLTFAELEILAAGPPAHRPHDERGWKAERNKYDRLVARQRKLASAAGEPQPPLRRSARLEQKMLHVSDEWLATQHPKIGRVGVGTPVPGPDERHVRRRISATTTTPGGSQHVEAEEVAYTVPPKDEAASEEKRRHDRARRREEQTLARLDFGGWERPEPDESSEGGVQPPLQVRAERGSLKTNQFTAGDWVWLPEEPQAGAHALVASVSGLALAKVQQVYGNGAVGVQLFDECTLTFGGSETRLPPPRSVLHAHQRLLALTSLRPHWVGQRVRLLNHHLMPYHYTFNAEHYDRYVERCGGLQAAFDAGWASVPLAARGHGSTCPSIHELDARLRDLGVPRLGQGRALWGSEYGMSEVAVITKIDLHARCDFQPFPECPIDLTWGTADVQCFAPSSMSYCGLILRGVPLYMVHGLHYSTALAEARAGASWVACRLSGIADVLECDDDGCKLGLALDVFNGMYQQIVGADVATLASLVETWGDAHTAQLVATRQSEADRCDQIQAMLRAQAGLTDLGEADRDPSCDPSFHFEPVQPPDWKRWFRWKPLLSDFCCCERRYAEEAGPSEQHADAPSQHESVPPSQHEGLIPVQHGGGTDLWPEDYEPVPSCPECTSQSVSWDRDPSAGGVCADCGYVKSPESPDTPVDWSDHDSDRY